MIARTMSCINCKKEVLERFTNDDYSEFLANKKRAEKQGIELGWFCIDCADKMCVMCRNAKVTKYIPAKEQDEIRKKIPTCQTCFDRFKKQLGFTEEINPEELESLTSVTHTEWQEFVERAAKK